MTRINQEKCANTGRLAIVPKVNNASLLMQAIEIVMTYTAQEGKAQHPVGMEATVPGQREEGASLDTMDKAAKEVDNTNPTKLETK